MITAILIDDEQNALDALAAKIKIHCPEVSIVARCISAREGLQAISTLQPDLLFLDIEMPLLNGFSLLEQIEKKDFQVIFTTAYNQYAIKAFKFNALDYLLKPVDGNELQEAVVRFTQRKAGLPKFALEAFLQSIRSPQNKPENIALPTLDGLEFVAIRRILRFEAVRNYARVFLEDGKHIVVCRTLKEWEHLLAESNFLRVHHSHLININHIKKYIKGEGGTIIMEDGTEIDVAVRKKQAFLELFTRR